MQEPEDIDMNEVLSDKEKKIAEEVLNKGKKQVKNDVPDIKVVNPEDL